MRRSPFLAPHGRHLRLAGSHRLAVDIDRGGTVWPVNASYLDLSRCWLLTAEAGTTVGTTTFLQGGTNSVPFPEWYRGKRDRGQSCYASSIACCRSSSGYARWRA